MPAIDIVPEKPFGQLLTKEFLGSDKSGHQICRCLCKCGNTVVVTASHLRSGDTQSCGCLRKQRARETHSTHGMTNTPEHGIWNGIKARCLNTNQPAYRNYGGRHAPELPITICDEWRADFMAFYNHVGPRPSPRHTIERIDNNKGYEPGNVIWDTRTAQARNRRSNRMLTFNSETHCIAEWAEITPLTAVAISARLARNWSVERALSTPPQARSK